MSGRIAARRATPQDRHALLELWLELVEHHRGLGRQPPLPGLQEALRSEIQRGLERDGCGLWVAEDESGSTLGFVFAQVDPGSDPETRRGDRPGWIHELFVRAKARRRGAGSLLVGRAEAWLRERGASRVRVRVEPGNVEGLAFWEARGFDERSRILERET